MSTSRRDLLRFTGLATLASVAGFSRAADNDSPRRLGLIFPPAGRGVPEEGVAMYGGRVEFLIETLGLETMTPAGYDAVIDRIGPCAEKLAERQAEAIVLMGTSLSFYRGQEFNQRLTQLLVDHSGLASVTMSTAIVSGLERVGARQVAAATAYNDAVNARLRSFLDEHSFDVLGVQGLGIEAVEDIFSVTQPQLIEFGANVVARSPGADALLVSCGGLRTLEILAPLEARTGRPAVSSTPHALFAGATLMEMDAHVSGYGSLLSGKSR